MKEEQKKDISLAWHTAVFNNQKKIKPLDKYLNKFNTNKSKMRKEEQLESIKKAKELDKKRGDI